MRIFYALLACCVIALPSYAQKNGDKAGIKGDPVQISLGGDLVQARSHVKGPDDATGKPTLVFQRFALSGTVNLKTPGKAVDVTLTNPNSKVKFFLPGQALTDANAQSSLKLSLPGDGSAKHFQVASDSETGSSSVGDTVIEADSSQKKVGSAKLTVFWFDGQMNTSQGLSYTALDQEQHTPAANGGYNPDYSVLIRDYAPYKFNPPGVKPDFVTIAIVMKAQASLKPIGLKPTLPQLQGLTVGIIQESKGATGSKVVGYPTWLKNPDPNQIGKVARDQFLLWDDKNTKVGTQYVLPVSIKSTISSTGGLDGDADPYYDKVGQGALDITKGTTVSTTDAPTSQGAPGTDKDSGIIRYYDSFNVHVADLFYSVTLSEKRDEDFVDWCAVAGSASDKIVLVKQGGWGLHLDIPQNNSAKPGSSGEVTDAYPTNKLVNNPSPDAVPVSKDGFVRQAADPAI